MSYILFHHDKWFRHLAGHWLNEDKSAEKIALETVLSYPLSVRNE